MRLLLTPLLLLALAAGDAAAQQDPLRIMPLGDSITQGAGAPGGYRAPLYERITDELGRPNFVGANSGVFLDPPSLIDHGHDGYGGFRIGQIADGEGIFGAPDVPIEERLNHWDPAVVLLHAGTNDMLQDYYVDGNAALGIPSAIGRLEALVERIVTHSPQVYVVVAEIAPTSFDGANARIEAFNAQIPAMAARQRALGRRVGVVNMYDPLLPFQPGDFSGAHPNAQGYQTMADIWFAAVQSISPLKNLDPGRDDGVRQAGYYSTASTRPWPPSTTDLLHAGGPTLAGVTHQGYGGLNPLSALNDGLAEGGTFDSDDTWTSTFTLDTDANAAGYDVTSIRSGSGGPFGIFHQAYELSYATVDAPDAFVPIGDFHHIPVNSEQLASGMILRAEAGVLASRVKRLRFAFVDPPMGGQTGYYEVEATGRPSAGAAPAARAGEALPERLALHPAAPNPFAGATVLRFDLPAPGPVRLSVYDVTGRRVATPLDGAAFEAGSHAVPFDGDALPSGVYLVRLEAAGAAATRRITRVR